MSHAQFEAQIDAQLDGELGATEARELEAHVAGCASCAAFRQSRLALRSAIREITPVASDLLRQRVRGRVRGAARQSVRLWGMLAIAACAAVVATGTWVVSGRRGADYALANEVLSSHIRGLMPGHLTDVTSTDQHTVKPWFNGKLDYSPPVTDFAGKGYPLVGGRLDYVGGEPVAGLIYARRQHMITVYLWPVGRGPATGSARDANGYHLRHLISGGNVYWIASDLGDAELDEFVGLLKQSDASVAPQ